VKKIVEDGRLVRQFEGQKDLAGFGNAVAVGQVAHRQACPAR
jgi:hypothetical protein